MRLFLVCLLFEPAIPTSFFNFIQLLLYLYNVKVVAASFSRLKIVAATSDLGNNIVHFNVKWSIFS